MATVLDARLLLNMAVNYTNTLDLQTPTAPLNLNRQYNFQDGVGANQANRIWSDTRTISASGTDTIDLAGSLTDAFGQSLTFARVKAFLVAASPNNMNNVVVGGATNAFASWLGDASDTIVIRPGGLLMLVAPDATGYVVTGGSADEIRVANSAGGSSVTYDVIVIGGAS